MSASSWPTNWTKRNSHVSDGYHIEDEIQAKAYDSRLMRRLLGYVRPFKFLLTMATVLLVGATFCSAAAPLLTMNAIDWYINNPERTEVQQAIAGYEEAGESVPAELRERAEALKAGDRQNLLWLVAIIALVRGGEALFRYAQLLTVSYVGQRTLLNMRMQIFGHLQRLSLSFLDKHPIGRLMTRVTNDVENLQQTIVTGLVQVISDLFTILVVLGFMFYINWQLALVTTSTVPFIFIASWIFRRFARRTYLEIRKKIARLNAYMQENVTGMRVVQVFGREDRNFREFDRRNVDHREEWYRQVRNFAVYFPTVDALGMASVALIILFGGYQMLQGVAIAGGTASVGMLYAYVQWAERMFSPVRALADRYNMLQEAMASSERIFHLLDTEEEVQDKEDAVVPEHIDGHVTFENVWFAYEDSNWVLRDVNIDIAPGERLAIVGHTGAGKTTFTSLLSRFYDIQHGRILVDGVDVRDYAQAALRANIGVVLQDVFLFSGTIRHNIKLGSKEMSDAWMRSCADYVNAHRFIERLPGQYDYDVGERGCNLSTGQRQLIAFARTLAHEPRILMLDEATSSIDTETEALIQDAIHKLMENRTAIVIAHRLSTVQHADRIVVMHHGEIREMGTHQELIAQRGLYYRLYRLQYKDQEHVA